MITQFYAFGSICRGEIDRSSDIDLLACLSSPNANIDTEKFSVYQHDRLTQLWQKGNPFAWHLHLESRLLFTSNGEDFIRSLGMPAPYADAVVDCHKFERLFTESLKQISTTNISATFNLSCMFLAIRNFATCYSLSRGKPIFSRKSPLMIDTPLEVAEAAFCTFSRARVLSTRGIGEPLLDADVRRALEAAPSISLWMSKLLIEVNT